MVRRSVPDDSYGRGAFARSIELGEVETLPRAELDRAVAYRERHAIADEDGFDMRGAISFSVCVFRIARDHALERGEQVFLHIGVGILVYEDRGGCVRDAYGDEPVTHLRARDGRLH